MECTMLELRASLASNHPSSIRLTRALLSELRKTARGFMIVATDGFWGTREPYAGFIRDLETDGCTVLDVISCAGYDGTRMTLPEDAHWNARGHRFVARKVHDFIVNRHLLDRDRSAP
jgi:hypothetical protein